MVIMLFLTATNFFLLFLVPLFLYILYTGAPICSSFARYVSNKYIMFGFYSSIASSNTSIFLQPPHILVEYFEVFDSVFIFVCSSFFSFFCSSPFFVVFRVLILMIAYFIFFHLYQSPSFSVFSIF